MEDLPQAGIPASFEPLCPGDEEKIREMSALASGIIRDYYDPIIGKEQNDYMLEKFQSAGSIRNQLEHGYRYFFVSEADRRIGFLAFFPREGSIYLSKLYLKKEARGKGHGKEMLSFVMRKAREEGFSSIELNVNRFNSTVQIYEKLGFRVIRTEKNDIGSGFYMDDYVYRLDF